jgi:hypothetical protein
MKNFKIGHLVKNKEHKRGGQFKVKILNLDKEIMV